MFYLTTHRRLYFSVQITNMIYAFIKRTFLQKILTDVEIFAPHNIKYGFCYKNSFHLVHYPMLY